MLEVSDLTIAVGGRTLCSHLGFRLLRGNVMAILGPNGRGKTTLLRTLLGFHPASTGNIRFNEHCSLCATAK